MTDHNEQRRERYAEDTEYRETMLAAKRKQYAEDDAFREGMLAGKRQRYAEDPAYREETLAANREHYEVSREQTLAARRQRYADDPQHREQVKAANRQRNQQKKAEQELLFPPLPKKKTMSNAERRLWRTYGLTQADYDLLAAAQNGVCAICERKPRGKLCVDHDHATRQLRFLLCRSCNIGFGHFGDNAQVV